jgi:mono/diheme cytochrome c family protein
MSAFRASTVARPVVTVFIAAAALVLPAGSARLAAQNTPALVIESVAGRDNFDRYCATCHGTDGKGGGPVAAALRSRPADLTSIARGNSGIFPRERVAAFVRGTSRVEAHGSADMPVWGPVFSGLEASDARVQQRIENIVTYVESLQRPSTALNDPGSQLFRAHCATCHGTTARGNGPMADQLRRPTPDLTRYTARNGGVFPSERVRRIVDGRDVASHGDREMPVWGDVFKMTAGGDPAVVKARIDAIVKYLEGIQLRSAHVPGHTGALAAGMMNARPQAFAK